MERTPTLRRSAASQKPSSRKTVIHSVPPVPSKKVQTVRSKPRSVEIAPLQKTTPKFLVPSSTSPPILRHDEFLESLEARLHEAQAAQDRWYESVVSSEDVLAARNAKFHEIEAQRESYIADEERRANERQRAAEIVRMAREAAAAEVIRIAAEKQRREEDERARLQLAEIQRQQAEAEQRRVELAAEVAAEEARIQRRLEIEEEHLRLVAEEIAWAEAEAAAAAEERRIEEEARLRDCSVCMERFDMDVMVEAPCSHYYCQDDIRTGIIAASTTRNVFQCCGQIVPANLIQGAVSHQQFRDYEELVLERTTVNPVYCANSRCGLFVPPSQAQGPDQMQCNRCHTSTCRHCRARAHNGVCQADEAAQATRRLAQQRGWKACPSCQTMVEKSSGCMHMTCRCGMGFCYRCGRPRNECNDRCGSIW